MNIKRLFSADYDTNLLTRLELDSVGSNYKSKQSWFTIWIIVFITLFSCIAVGYTKGWDGGFGKDWQDFVSQPWVGTTVAVYIITTFTITGVLLWALPRYGRNNKSFVVEYFVERSQEYATLIKRVKVLPRVKVVSYWETFSKKRKKNLVEHAFEGYIINQGVDDAITNEFIDLLDKIEKEDLLYKDLPEWVTVRIMMYNSLYYLYLDNKDRADTLLGELAFHRQ